MARARRAGRRHRHEVHAIAGIRWFANSIENLATQKYIGDVRRLDAIHAILKDTMDDLEDIPRPERNVDCPWPPCGDMCVPRCPRPPR